VNKSSSEDNQKQRKSRFGSARAQKSSDKNNMEQNTFKIDVNSITVETSPDNGIGVEL
jgi:hypothetical protein